MKPVVRSHRIASLFFGFAAVAPIGTWLIFLFDEVPINQEHFAKAARALSYAFSAPETLWFFALLTALPVALLALSVLHWKLPAAGVRTTRWLAAAGGGATLLALTIQWPAAIAAGVATYYGYKRAEV
jgi:uncharacterized BrkB/YihY/UPF0761 family membrane protein